MGSLLSAFPTGIFEVTFVFDGLIVVEVLVILVHERTSLLPDALDVGSHLARGRELDLDALPMGRSRNAPRLDLAHRTLAHPLRRLPNTLDTRHVLALFRFLMG